MKCLAGFLQLARYFVILVLVNKKRTKLPKDLKITKNVHQNIQKF